MPLLNTSAGQRTRASGGSVFGSVAGGGLSGAAKGAAIGSVVPGLGTATGAIIGGLGGLVKGWLGGKKKKRDAENLAALQNAKMDQGNLERMRRQSVLGSLLAFMEADPKKQYGSRITKDMFGWKPGAIEESDLYDIAAPEMKTSSGWEDFAGGLSDAAEGYINNKAAADADVQGKATGGIFDILSKLRGSRSTSSGGGGGFTADTSGIRLNPSLR